MSLPETPTRVVLFLSTLSLRRATFLFADHIELRAISIHALLAESDQPATKQAQNLLNFYPRSPCGERRTKTAPALRGLYFYPRSPCGERRTPPSRQSRITPFLSTLSLRRATERIPIVFSKPVNFYPRSLLFRFFSLRGISIHALLAESDLASTPISPARLIFLSTLSLRRATVFTPDCFLQMRISIHALLAESDVHTFYRIDGISIFLSTLSLRRATGW